MEQQQKTKNEGRANRTILWRSIFMLCMFGIVMFLPLLWKLWNISITNHDTYEQAAIDQQTRDVSVSAMRGTIYDAKGNILAMSATVYNLILSPRDVVASVSADDYETDAAYEAAVAAKQKLIVDGVCQLLPDLDRETVEKRIGKTNSAYEILAKELEDETATTLREFIAENKLSVSLYLSPTTTRYYPYSSLASQVIGFVNDNGGAYGIEAIYDDKLEGTTGRVVTAKNAAGTEMLNSYSDYIDAANGDDLTLTIDTTIQCYAEQTVREGIEKYAIQNGGMCIVMDPNTGAILGMVSIPDYDLNDPSLVIDTSLSASLAALKGDPNTTEEAYSAAVTAARNAQWRSKALNDTYEPGSTFKSVVLSAALEEGAVSENDTFYCNGSYVVNGVTIRCWKHAGHGSQTLTEAVENSCNPAFMQIGQKLGAEKFYDYFTAFGLTKTTGIDLQGEALGTIWKRDYITSPEGYLSLATASFGQRFTVTPIQMITAFAATINGGKLVEPYVVQRITDCTGNVVENRETTVVRQVVSQGVSEKVASILEKVVSEGTGGNAYVTGYRVGGKTGTAETSVDDQYVVSFVGFAPADDPQVIVLLAYDTPQVNYAGSNYSTTGYYISGGQMAAPMAGELIGNILEYMGVEREYSEAEANGVDTTVPSVTGQTASSAISTLEGKKFTYRTVGDGSTVTGQIPAAGASIPSGSQIVLYLGEDVPTEPVTVPDVTGLTLSNARAALAKVGLYMKATGVSTYYSDTTVAGEQSREAGSSLAQGSVVEVRFVNNNIYD